MMCDSQLITYIVPKIKKSVSIYAIMVIMIYKEWYTGVYKDGETDRHCGSYCCWEDSIKY